MPGSAERPQVVVTSRPSSPATPDVPEVSAGAFILPNAVIPDHAPLESFSASGACPFFAPARTADGRRQWSAWSSSRGSRSSPTRSSSARASSARARAASSSCAGSTTRRSARRSERPVASGGLGGASHAGGAAAAGRLLRSVRNNAFRLGRGVWLVVARESTPVFPVGDTG
jgi:hypothetical protein